MEATTLGLFSAGHPGLSARVTNVTIGSWRQPRSLWKGPVMAAVIIALVVGVFAGALVVWMVTRGLGQAAPGVMQSQGEIKARLEDTLAQVQRIGAIFANAAQRGRAGEFVLENLLEATGMDRHRDFELQVATEGARPDVVLNLPGRGRLVIDAKFPLDDFQRAAAAAGEDERRK